METIITQSEKETFELAKKLSKKLKGGDILGLKGSLGAGKTIFVKGVALGLGIEKTVQSPTFVIMMLYQANPLAGGQKSKIKYLCHIDAYRIKEKDLVSIGAADYLRRPDTLTIIEWAGKVKKTLPKKVKWVTLRTLSQHKRKISLDF